jgi:beta-xylosidase
MNATGTRDAGASFLLTDAAHHDFRGSSRAVIEAPQVIRRGNTLWLFTSRGGYRDCEYSTFAYRSTSIRSGKWNYASALLTPSNSGFCGPGGAEVVNDRGTFRIAFHVWKGGVPASRSTNAVRTTWIGTLGWNAKGNPYVR